MRSAIEMKYKCEICGKEFETESGDPECPFCEGVNYDLILQFDDQSPSFAYGFQAGQIWTKMDSCDQFTEMFSGEILELVQRMASRKNYSFKISSVRDGWYLLNAVKKLPPELC